TIANLFVAIFEEEQVLQHLDTWLFYLKRFIHDGFGIWLYDQDPAVDKANWTTFQSIVNKGGLEWEFTKRSDSVVSMNMTIKIVDGKIEIALYTKPLALYIYIPPHSCHSPGVLPGLIFGNILRIYQLCSRQEDIDKELSLFLKRILDRGYQLKNIQPIFAKAITNALQYLSQSKGYRLTLKAQQDEESRNQVYYHLPYHPNNPSAARIQQLWHQHVSAPAGKISLLQKNLHTKGAKSVIIYLIRH
ncbi:hypothetical protein ACHAXR_001060, partial [Thalassiosira sp. AJA248-18]